MSSSASHLSRSRSAVRPNTRTRLKSAVAAATVPKTSELTLVVLGDTQVGKTAMVSQFLWNGFVADYRPTVEEFNWIEYEMAEDEHLMLQVIDSGGSRDFLAMRHLYVRTANAFVVVFSIDIRQSLEEAKKIVGEIREAQPIAPIVLVANKVDKCTSVGGWADEEATQFALDNAIPLLSITAKDVQQVGRAFRKVLEGVNPSGNVIRTDQLKKRRQSMPVVTRSSGTIDQAQLENLSKRHTTTCSIQ